MSPHDVPKLLLSMVARLLPRARQDWGRAMDAELTGIAEPHERWIFASGCAAAVVRQVEVLKSLVYTGLTLAGVAGVVVWSMGISYLPMRWGVLGMMVALAGLITLGRVRSSLGPVAQNNMARLLRSGGVIAIAVAAASFVAHMRERNNQIDEARYGVPIVGSLLLCYLIGFVAVTADRSAATSRTLRWGTVSGVTMAFTWLAAAFAMQRVPASLGLAIVMLLVAVGVAVASTAKHPAQAWVAALVAGTVGTLSIVLELVVLSVYAPAQMIPNLAPAALTAADSLEQSRAELQDPYVLLFLIGAVIALALGIFSRLAPGIIVGWREYGHRS